MESTQNLPAEELARLFHLYHQALTEGRDEKQAQETADSWAQLPTGERKARVAAARLALLDLAEASEEQQPTRPYFAKPGEADWGC